MFGRLRGLKVVLPPSNVLRTPLSGACMTRYGQSRAVSTREALVRAVPGRTTNIFLAAWPRFSPAEKALSLLLLLLLLLLLPPLCYLSPKAKQARSSQLEQKIRVLRIPWPDSTISSILWVNALAMTHQATEVMQQSRCALIDSRRGPLASCNPTAPTTPDIPTVAPLAPATTHSERLREFCAH